MEEQKCIVVLSRLTLEKMSWIREELVEGIQRAMVPRKPFSATFTAGGGNGVVYISASRDTDCCLSFPVIASSLLFLLLFIADPRVSLHVTATLPRRP